MKNPLDELPCYLATDEDGTEHIQGHISLELAQKTIETYMGQKINPVSMSHTYLSTVPPREGWLEEDSEETLRQCEADDPGAVPATRVTWDEI